MSKEQNFFPSKASPDSFVDVPKYIEFDSEELPEILGWMVGGRYHVELFLEQESESKDGDGQERIRSRFKILDVKTKAGDMPDHIRKLINNTH